MQGAFDLAVVGSGFAGSLLAMIGRRLGRSVVLIEKGKHPRFAIGESSTPLANLILEELADRYALPEVRALTQWGTWQKSHPDVACGLKRGFTFYHQKAGFHFSDDATHRAQLLVAASPNDFVADTHWYRPDFDAMMVREAQAMGVVYLDETELWGVDIDQKRPVIQGRRGGRPLELHVAFIADASGPRGFLHRALELPELPFRNLPPTQALYSHFIGVKKWSELQPPDAQPPYPIDDAALHHVFDGGWIWVLRFNNGITSAGVAATDEGRSGLGSLDFTQGEESWERLLKRFPSIEAQFSEARAVQPFTHARRLSFLSGEVAGRNWALLPSAAGFVDPLLSTGFPLTLLGIERLAEILQRNSEGDKLHAELCHYSMQTTAELVAVERLVAALYATMHDFELFAALTMVYFAAASFTESVRRLGKPELAGRTFLLGERPGFGPAFRSCVDLAMRRPEGRERSELLAKIQRAIDPINIAGLGVEERRRWYPALASDLLAGAAKLESTPGEVQAMLRRCGLG